MEALVAMAVLSVSLIAIHNAMRQAVITRAQARDYTHARLLLDRLMAEMALMPEFVEREEAGDFGDAFPNFAWQRSIQMLTLQGAHGGPGPAGEAAAQMGRLAHLRATVTWTRGGRAFSESMETLMRDPIPIEEPDDAAGPVL